MLCFLAPLVGAVGTALLQIVQDDVAAQIGGEDDDRVPVSYTHLDVYKRQHIPCSRCAMVSRKLLDRVRAAARGRDSVTELLRLATAMAENCHRIDVYKRQAVR